MNTLHIVEQGQSGTLFIRDGGERLECGVGAPGQPVSTYLTIRPEQPMAVHMGPHGWLLGHYQREEPTTKDESYLHWFNAQHGARCGLYDGMQVACGFTVPHRDEPTEDDGERFELPPRRGMFALSDGEPTLLITIPERQRVTLEEGTWFRIYLGGVWIWGTYRARPVEAGRPTSAHLFYLSEGATHDDFCALLPGVNVALPS